MPHKNDKVGAAAAPSFKQIFEALPGNSILVQTDEPRFTVMAATPDYLQNSGHTKETLIGKGVFEAFPANTTDPAHKGDKDLLASFQDVLRLKQACFMPLQRYDLQNPDGSFTEKHWRVSNKPVFVDGDICCIIHTAEDITDLLKAERQDRAFQELLNAYRKVEESQEALKRFQFMAGHAQDPFILTRQDGSFAYLNQKALEAWGYTEEEAPSLRVPDVDPIYQDEAFADVFRRAQTGERLRFETLHKRKDGHIFPVEVNMNGITLGDRPYMFAVARDITERKKAEEALRRSEERLQKVLSIETVGVIYFDLDGGIHDANAAFERMSGFSKEAICNGAVRWDELTPPEFREATLKSREEFLTRGENTPYEKQYIRPDGTRWWGLFAGRRLSETEYVEFVVDVTQQKQFEAALETKVKERTAELEAMNRELNRSNQNLEEFAHAASHDLKEPVRKIHFFTQLLKEKLGGRVDEEETRSLTRIENATERMTNLIDDLLLYSHVSQRPPETDNVDLNVKVQRALEDLELDIAEKGAVVQVARLPVVRGYSRQLQQLFQNLIGNALKYSKAGVPPRIEISNGEVTEAGRRYYRIAVKDNGIGFPQEYADQIFQMFTRLHGKHEYSGTGVGLSIVKKVVDNHHGFIRVESAPGEGSTFAIFLPAEG